MKRLLCIIGSMDVGGAETFLMKNYRILDKRKYQMDFCVANANKGAYEDEIIKMGGRIFRVTPKTKSTWRNFNDIKKIVSENQYKNVMRISQNSLSSLELLAAKKGGATNLIFRSSNSSVYGGKGEKIVHVLFRPIANRISNVKIAPSDEAGKFMFGRAKYTIIKNGLSINDYRYSDEFRKKYRKAFGANDDVMVIGHVGRFNKQKNHRFIIDVFEKYYKQNKDSVLWLLGCGELETEISQIITRKRLTNNVKMLGIRKDVNKIYSAMDCFVFPSLFEGMPNTVIEAQVSGLPCILADTITKECKITDHVDFCSLMDLEQWVEKIKKNDCRKLEDYSGYDIESVNKIFIREVYK